MHQASPLASGHYCYVVHFDCQSTVMGSVPYGTVKKTTFFSYVALVRAFYHSNGKGTKTAASQAMCVVVQYQMKDFEPC